MLIGTDVDMNLVVSGKFTPDVGSDSLRLANEFEAQIARMLNSIELETTLAGIVLFPTILNPRIIKSMVDHVTVKRKERSVFVATTIEYEKWMRASVVERINLMAENIDVSLRKIKETYLPRNDLTALLVFVAQAREILLSQHQH